MIRILRSATTPAVLSGRGVESTLKLCALYDKGEREFTFSYGVYAHASVKASLIEAQHGKCCFCERRVGTDGDVEHFRPKGGVRQSPDAPLEKPGYYWLAYDWDNLFLSCGPCNSRNKRNLFPLAKGTSRSKHHKDDHRCEAPLFVNPAADDPQSFIGWRSEVPIALNDRGETTIRALGLDRRALLDIRREHLVTFAKLIHWSSELRAKGIVDVAAKIDHSIVERLRDSAEFAAATRSFAVDQGTIISQS